MVSESMTSGKKVNEWCRENGINVSTYNKRLNVLRTEIIKGSEKQSIVPVVIQSQLQQHQAVEIMLSTQMQESIWRK